MTVGTLEPHSSKLELPGYNLELDGSNLELESSKTGFTILNIVKKTKLDPPPTKKNFLCISG